jgi:hypothetical protein
MCNRTATGGLWSWLCALVSAGSLDWYLTWLHVEKGYAFEANPIAAYILKLFGWSGLALFKATSVLLVAVVVTVLARKNRAAAERLLQFGCACTFVIVGYSLFLIVREKIEDTRLVEKENRRIALALQQRRQFMTYSHKVDELTRLVIAENRPLVQAVQELVGYLEQIDRPPLGSLGVVGAGPHLEECLAAHVICHAGYLLRKQPRHALRLLVRLQSEYASAFSSPTLPTSVLDWFPPRGAIIPEELATKPILSQVIHSGAPFGVSGGKD